MFWCHLHRRSVGTSVSRFDFSNWLEQRLLHAHLCWRVGLPGQKHCSFTFKESPRAFRVFFQHLCWFLTWIQFEFCALVCSIKIVCSFMLTAQLTHGSFAVISVLDQTGLQRNSRLVWPSFPNQRVRIKFGLQQFHTILIVNMDTCIFQVKIYLSVKVCNLCFQNKEFSYIKMLFWNSSSQKLWNDP